MMARRVNVTDRAHRYRANALAPSGPKVCAWCGSRENITVDHKDGWPDHTRRSNLQYLCKSCNTAKGIAFKEAGRGRPTKQYNPASKEPPTFQQYAWAVSQQTGREYVKGRGFTEGDYGEAGAIIHATPKSLRSEYAARIAAGKKGRARSRDMERWNPWPFSDKRLSARQTTPATGGAAYHSSRKKADDLNRQFIDKPERLTSAGRYKGYTISKTPDGEYFSSLDRASWFPTKAAAQRHIDSYQKGRGNPAETKRKAGGKLAKTKRKAGGKLAETKRNPSDAAADAFKEFHGHASKELVTVKRKVHHHSNLAAAGELRGMSIKPVSKVLPVRHIGGLKDALLCFNEAKNQLFIEGGDQFMSDGELKKFGITHPHELETLGKVVALDYFTDKTHLGDEGGEAVYAHKLRTTNENGRHVVVAIARYPDLIYRVLDQQMEFSGGSYEIRAEGIDK
jgi:hypothetical protein